MMSGVPAVRKSTLMLNRCYLGKNIEILSYTRHFMSDGTRN